MPQGAGDSSRSQQLNQLQLNCMPIPYKQILSRVELLGHERVQADRSVHDVSLGHPSLLVQLLEFLDSAGNQANRHPIKELPLATWSSGHVGCLPLRRLDGLVNRSKMHQSSTTCMH